MVERSKNVENNKIAAGIITAGIIAGIPLPETKKRKIAKKNCMKSSFAFLQL
jgi:hypothetical protein